jgi:hypothetical protein
MTDERRRLMAEKHDRKSPQRKEEDDSSASPGDTKKGKSANKVSAITEDVLDDIDRALKETCGFDDDESISDEEFAERANVFVMNYQQKGGQ